MGILETEDGRKQKCEKSKPRRHDQQDVQVTLIPKGAFKSSPKLSWQGRATPSVETSQPFAKGNIFTGGGNRTAHLSGLCHTAGKLHLHLAQSQPSCPSGRSSGWKLQGTLQRKHQSHVRRPLGLSRKRVPKAALYIRGDRNI